MSQDEAPSAQPPQTRGLPVRQWLRSWPVRVVLVLLGLALAVVAWVGSTAGTVAQDLDRARAQVSALTADSTTLDTKAVVSAVRLARASVEHASTRVHDPVWTVAAHTPFLGRTPAAVRTTTSVLADLLAAVEPAEAALLTVPATAGQPISPALLQAVSGLARELKPALVAADARLSGIKLRGVPAQVSTAVTELRAQVHAAVEGFDEYQGLLEVAPILLGLDRPHTWLLLLQNGAEARTTGGLIGATGLLRAQNGTWKLTRLEPNDVLASAPIPDHESVVGKDSELAQLYGQDFSWFLDVNQSPNFEITARLAMLAERRAHGDSADGVIAMDQHTLSYLMEVTGPVSVGGVTVTADTAVRYVTRDIYAPFLTQPAAVAVTQKDARLAALVQAVFAKLSSGQLSPLSLARVFAKSAQDYRIALWSADPAEQTVISRTSIGHTPDQAQRPRVQVAIVNASGNKLEAYIQAHVEYSLGACRTDLPRRAAAITVRLTNTAPASGLPRYVAGRLDLNQPDPRPQGSTRELVYVHLPRGSSLVKATFAGKEIEPIGHANESQRKVYRFLVVSKGQSVQDLVVNYDESTVEQVENPRVGVQPMALPMTTSVRPSSLCPAS
ncbi:MAG: DUF4012 domain-containing protein [Actinobacteria bacterium]|nr:DUF4012 domain-containing protein [Actinomycetota bacterium]